MRRLFPVLLPPWALPLIVLGLIAPGIAAFAVAGPQLGLAVGALTVAVVILLAARARFDEPIEVATASDRRYRLLIVAPDALDDPAAVEQVVDIVGEGNRSRRDAAEAEPQLLVLAPATQSRLDRWATDLRAAQADANDRLVVSVAALAAAGLEATGRVGDGDLVQALEDELHAFAADEVAIVTPRGVRAGEVDEVRRRLDRPVRTVEPAQPRSISSA